MPSAALRFRLVRFAMLILFVAPVLAGCIGQADDRGTIAWEEIPPTPEPTVQPTVQPTEEPMTGLGGATGPLPTTEAGRFAPSNTTHNPSAILTAEELRQAQPNELGVVPILEYHVITTDPEQEAQFVRLADKMRADLQWLYDNDFRIVPLSDVVNNSIQVPPGKHPVALTFDDGTSSHFSYLEDANGELVLDESGDPVIDPDCAVGILEAFYEEHPDFGHGAHFAPLIFNAFAEPDQTDQAHLFDQKVLWMVENGYEIGNHTWQHTNLTDISTEEFMMTVAEPQVYMDNLLGDHPGNASDILTLPYGTTPDGDLHPDQRQMMRDGFTYNGHPIFFRGALLVGADPAYSPASTEWDKLWIPRVQMFDESVDFWFGMFERGDIIPYTSDGNPETIAVPNPQHPALEGLLDTESLAVTGKTLIQYNPEDGSTVAMAPDVTAPVARADRRETVAGAPVTA